MYKIKYHKINVYFSISLYRKSFWPFCEALCSEDEGGFTAGGGRGWTEMTALGPELRGRVQGSFWISVGKAQ